MVTAGIMLFLAAYLGFGALITYAAKDSLQISAPKWVAYPAITLLWPLVIVVFFYAILQWMARGSH